ncbi:MAG: CusA/CzcA family heavy metal efflux RND transporter [Bacteroidetes bacterium]|nr:CusA/CzcA family heavy metal efflux RND transporter [Bacteroidota bacterium]
MLNKIITFSIRNKLIVGIMVLALIAYGLYSTTKLPVDAVPDITNNQVLVITSSPSLGAADIERLITFPVEQATINIPGIIEQRSFSRFGLSLVTIVFNDNTDVYWARQQVSERLLQVQSQVPPSLGIPTLGPVTTGLGEIFQYVVKAKPGYEGKYDAMELRTIQDWIVRRQLLTTKGVADVSSFGGKLKQYEIGVNTDKLKLNNLTISDIFSALEKNNQNTGGAYIEKGPTVLFIRSEGLVKRMEDIASIMIKTLPDGTPVTIQDVADVKLGEATRYGAMCYNDKGEVAGAVVMMLKGANSSEVVKAVKEKITTIEKQLPEGVTIEPFLDRTKMVNNAIGTVEKNLIEGALIVILVLVIFLGNLRAGLLVASVIPLAMLFAIIMMNLLGVSGNLMSLGALDFGLIIDGAVIIVEAVMHRLHQNKQFQGMLQISQQDMNEEVSHSAGKMMNAAVFGQIIILIVYLPILSLQGIEGKMFKPMAQTVAFAILGAFLLSLTYVPMMSALVLSKKISNKKNIADRMMIILESIYKRLLETVMRIPKTVVYTSVLMFAAAITILLSLGGEFIPKLEEGDFAVDTRVLTGSSLPTTIKSTQQASHILLHRFPEVEKVVTKIGSGEIPTDPMPIEASDMMVVLKPKSQWTSAKSFDELAEKMSAALNDVPGITAGFQFPVQMRFNELMTGGRQDVVCKIFGEDIDTLAAYAEKLGGIVATVNGAKDIYIETVTGLPQIVINYNRAALAQYGLTVGEVNNTVQSAFAGAVSGQVFENERRFDLVVRLNNYNRRDIADVQNLLIATPRGDQIPLQQVASVEIKVGPNQIQRENAQRRITVGFNVRGRDVQTIVKELQQKVNEHIKMPTAYYITYGGQFENLVAAKNRLAIAVPVSLLLIFLMLYFAFNSIQQGLLIFSAIPLSAIGGVFALWSRGMPFSISAGIGFIALFGVAVLNGIVLITEFNQLKQSGVMNVRERILKGTRIRLRPVLMTAAVASLGFMPMALSHGAGAEVQRPLATVVIGGLLSATILTLLVLPVLYLWFEKNERKTSPSRTLARRRLRKHKNKKNNNRMKFFLLLVLFALPGLAATAQNVISLQAALDSALNQNPEILSAAFKTRAAKAFEQSAYDVPLTTAAAEYGGINSAFNDTKFSFAQTTSFPVVYKRQQEWLQAQTTVAAGNEIWMKAEVKKQVTLLYYELLVLQQRKQLLLYADSLYHIFAQKQQQRFKAGDANMLEQTTAETQLMQVNQQLKQLQVDFTIVQTQLSRWMHSSTLFMPEAEDCKIPAPVTGSTVSAADNPAVQIKARLQQMAQKEIAVHQSRNLPQLSVGYNNQSIIGIQNINGADKYYPSSQRFSSVWLGLNFPLFNKANKARIAASKLNYSAAVKDYEGAASQYENMYRQLMLRKENSAGQLQYFEQAALPQAAAITEHANLQFANGAINYLEWIMLINQAITIRSGYLNAITDWNNTIIEINAIQNK